VEQNSVDSEVTALYWAQSIQFHVSLVNNHARGFPLQSFVRSSCLYPGKNMLSLILTSILAREWNWTFPSRYHEYSFADAVECDEHLTAVLIMRGDQTVSRSVCESPVVLRSQSCTAHVALSARSTHPPACSVFQVLQLRHVQRRVIGCIVKIVLKTLPICSFLFIYFHEELKVKSENESI
jgi:hypothetical protein